MKLLKQEILERILHREWMQIRKLVHPAIMDEVNYQIRRDERLEQIEEQVWYPLTLL